MKKTDKYIHGFAVHLPNLLHEIADAGLVENAGVLKIPLQITQRYLISITERAIQLNDPVLNKIMCDLALYSIADPASSDFNKEAVKKIDRLYNEHITKERKSIKQ